MFVDKDGSVSGQDGVWGTVLSNKPFHVTGECKLRSNWNMAYCPYMYGSVSNDYAEYWTFLYFGLLVGL